MHTTPAPALPTELRLNRLQKWLSLWLAWFVAHLLVHIAPRRSATLLARMRRYTRVLLLLRALHRVTPPAPPHRPRCYDPARTCRPPRLRVLLGHAFNRALKARDLAAQARRLYAIVVDPERWIARLVHRLKRRYTKLRRAPWFAYSVPLSGAAALDTFTLDTS